MVTKEANFVRELLRVSSRKRRLYSDGPGERICVFSDAAKSTSLASAATSDRHIVRYDCKPFVAAKLLDGICELECYGTLKAALHWGRDRITVGGNLCLYFDNTITVSWFKKGAVPKRPFLNDLMQQLDLIAAERSLTISCAHVPGRRNLVADAISRDLPHKHEFWDELVDFQNGVELAGYDA
jgi:hypothetical protein